MSPDKIVNVSENFSLKNGRENQEVSHMWMPFSSDLKAVSLRWTADVCCLDILPWTHHRSSPNSLMFWKTPFSWKPLQKV